MLPSLPPATSQFGVFGETHPGLIRFKRIRADGTQYLVLHEADEEIRDSQLQRMLNAESMDLLDCKDLSSFFLENNANRNLQKSGIRKVFCSSSILQRSTLSFYCQQDGEIKRITLGQLFEKFGAENMLAFN